MSRVILAIDPGERFAFAWNEGDTIHSMPSSIPKGKHPGHRWRCMRAQVHAQCNGVHPDVVVYEVMQRHISQDQARCSISYRAALEMACEDAGVACLPVVASEWQAWAVPQEWRPKGYGKGKGGQIVREQWQALTRRAAIERFGAPEAITDDEVAARCILAYALARTEFGGKQ
jgi:hypothetical protein